MNEMILEVLQPFAKSLIELLVGVLATAAFITYKKIAKEAREWYVFRTNESQRAILEKVGREAFAHAETVFKGMGGEAKLDGAVEYAATILRRQSIDISASEIKAAVHQAWLNQQVKVSPESLSSTGTSSDLKVT